MEERLGKDTSKWTYGQAKNKHIGITHSLGKVVKTPYRELLNLPSLPRGGNSYTPGSTGNNLNQSSGATFRIETPNWDSSAATNVLGNQETLKVLSIKISTNLGQKILFSRFIF